MIVCARALEQRIIFPLIPRAGIVEDHDGEGVSVAPKVIVVLFDGLTDLAQPIGRNDEK
jgi:hypothetical protein